MLQAEDCQNRADECARLAEASVNPVQIARYRYLETAWLYLFRLKVRARLEAELARRSAEPHLPLSAVS
jgi:hypothetical protein